MANSLLSTGLVTTCRRETSSQSRPRTPTPLLCTSIAQPSEATLSLVEIAVAPLQLNRTTGASQRHGNWATKLVPPQLHLALQRSSLCSPSSEHDKIQMARRWRNPSLLQAQKTDETNYVYSLLNVCCLFALFSLSFLLSFKVHTCHYRLVTLNKIFALYCSLHKVIANHRNGEA